MKMFFWKFLFCTLIMCILATTPAWAEASQTPSPSNNADKITDFAITKMNEVIGATKVALPKITQAVLDVTKYGCMVDIGTGLIWLIPLLASLVWMIFLYKVITKADDWGNESTVIGFAFMGVTPFILFFIVALINLTDFWLYICVANPEAYLIHQAILKVTN